MHLVFGAAGVLAVLTGAVMLGFNIQAIRAGAPNALVLTGVVLLATAFALLAFAVLLSRLRRIAETLDNLRVPLGSAMVSALGAGSEPGTAQMQADAVSASGATGSAGGPVQPPATFSGHMEAALATTGSAPDPAAVRIDESDRILALERPQTAGSAWPEPDGSEGKAVADPAAPQEIPRIVKSGLIEGMPYTLYSDGSVEAEMPHGIMRFGSVGEWRAHMRIPRP
jgi:hypothetical protein